jgi:hypothetical protein
MPATKVGRVAQVLECLPSKLEALSSNYSITKKKKHRQAGANCPSYPSCRKLGRHVVIPAAESTERTIIFSLHEISQF